MKYNHLHFKLNNRSISVQETLHDKPQTITDFESSTLLFIKSWLNVVDEFSLQTSGSTGTPKKIIAKRTQLEASAQNTIVALQLQPNSTALVCLNTQYIAGIMMLVRCMVGSMKMEIVEPAANPFEKLPANAQYDFCALVPYQVDAIIQKYGIEGINRIKKIIIGGAPLSYSLQQNLAISSSEIYLTYGMTETLSHVALQKISGSQSDNFFTALPTVSFSVDDRMCLVIDVPYLNEPIITNDIVELLSEQTFRWLGRWDNVINSGGVKLFPEKIEVAVAEVFEQLNLKNSFFVFGIPDAKLGTKVLLLVEGEVTLDKVYLLQALRGKLKAYEMPKDVRFLDQFIRTETGKTNRQQTILEHVFDE